MHAESATVSRCAQVLFPVPCPVSTFSMSLIKKQDMGLSRLTHGIQQGFMYGKRFLGQAYTDGKKFLSHLDNYAGIARGVIGAVAPVVGQLSGPVGSAVGTAVGAGVQALGQYDRLKMEAMNQGNQVANVGAAIRRGIG